MHCREISCQLTTQNTQLHLQIFSQLLIDISELLIFLIERGLSRCADPPVPQTAER